MNTLADDLKKLFSESMIDIWYRSGGSHNIYGLSTEVHIFHAGIKEHEILADICVKSVAIELAEEIMASIKQCAGKYNLFVRFVSKKSIIEIICFRIIEG